MAGNYMASRLKNKDIFIEWSKGFITKAAVIIEPYNAFANSLPFLIDLNLSKRKTANS